MRNASMRVEEIVGLDLTFIVSNRRQASSDSYLFKYTVSKPWTVNHLAIELEIWGALDGGTYPGA